MIEEEYVSFETAKLLKEKGFNEPCRVYYENYGRKQSLYIPIKRTEISNKDFKQRDNYNKRFNLPEENYRCTAPTQQMAMRWLREVHNIKVNVFYSNPNYAIQYFETNTQTGVDESVFIGEGYPVYEQACEVAIKYCLENLI